MKKPLVIILLGAAGSGKGTQAKLLQKEFNLEYVGGGELVRSRQTKKDYTAKKLLIVSFKKGELIPTFLISSLWTKRFEELKKKKSLKGILLDGNPRKILEAELINEALTWYGWNENLKVLLIDISKKESILRLTKRRTCGDCGRLIPYVGEFRYIKKCDKCGGKLFIRKDDSLTGIKKRLDDFIKETKIVVDYYKKQKKLIKINGEQSIEDVFKEIKKKIK